MKLTILSPTGDHRAALSGDPDGVLVVIRRAAGLPASLNHSIQVYRGVVDAPLHVVRDRIVDMLGELERGS